MKGKANLKFVNNGLIPVAFLTATLRESPQYEILSAKSVFVGDVGTADFETEEFTLIPKVTDPILVLDLQYRDQTNQEYITTTLVPLNVYTAEEAKQLGLLPGTNPLWMIVVLLCIIAVIWYSVRRIRKKKHDN